MYDKRPTARWGWRSILVALYLVCMSGCASIPPALDYASWALSGVAYMATGKGPSDHALSYVTKKDCSLLNLLFLQPLCKPVVEEEITELPVDWDMAADAENNSDSKVVSTVNSLSVRSFP